MEYVGVCLSHTCSDASGTQPSVAFPGGAVVRVAFSSKGDSLMASGTSVAGIRSWKVLAPLTSAEKAKMQEAEVARLAALASSASSTAAAREAEREAKFQQAEREKARAFAAEIEKEREQERREVAEEQMDTMSFEQESEAAGSVTGGSRTARSRRPSEMHSHTSIGGSQTARRPSELPGLSSSSASAAKKYPSWLTEVDEKEDSSSNTAPPASTATKSRKLARQAARAHAKKDGAGSDDDDAVATATKLPKLGGGAASSRKNTAAATSTVAQPGRLPGTAAGASTVRSAAGATTNDDLTTPARKEKGKTKEENSPPTTLRKNRSTLVSRRRRGDDDDDDASSTVSFSIRTSIAIASPDPVSPERERGGGDDSPTRKSMRSTMRRGGTSTRNSAENSRAASGRNSPTQQQQQPSSTASLYSDFDPECLAAKVRTPCCIQPLLARSLPPEASPLPDLAPGALWSLSGDQTMFVKMSSGAGGGNDERKLVFIDRLKGNKVLPPPDKPHVAPASALALSDDGRKCLVATSGGHIYSHSADSTKWQYVWLKIREGDDPVPFLDVQVSPDGLALLTARASKDNPLTVWNAKSGKIICMLDGGAPTNSSATAATAAAVNPSAAPGHTTCLIHARWLPDGESVLSVGFGLEDRCVRLWRGILRAAGAHARSQSLGRLNTPYTHFRPLDASRAYPRALAISPNGRLAAVAIGITIFIFSLTSLRCIFYQSLPELLSVAEDERDKSIGAAAGGWVDPYAGQFGLMTPSQIVHAHVTCPKMLAPPVDEAVLAIEKSMCTMAAPPAAAAALPAVTSPNGISASAAGALVSPPALTKRSSLARGETLPALGGGNLSPSAPPSLSKRASMGRDAAYLSGMVLSKRGSMQRMDSTAGAAGGSPGGTTANLQLPGGGAAVNGSSSKRSGRSTLVLSSSPSAIASAAAEAALSSAPAGLTPVLTQITCLSFSPGGSQLAVGTSLGALMVLEVSRPVLRGEEDVGASEAALWQARRRAQKAQAASEVEERARYAHEEARRQREATAAESAREAERVLLCDRREEREARRAAREEARRLKLYVGSLPETYVPPPPPKSLALDVLRRGEHTAALVQKVVSSRGTDFMRRLDNDLEERARRAAEREEQRLAEEAQALAAAARLHAEGASPHVVKAKQSSFLDRLNRDLDKRAGFRNVADRGEFYDRLGDKRYAKKEKLRARAMPDMRVPLPLNNTLPPLA